MSSEPALDQHSIVTAIRSWPAARRLRLAESILESLHQEFEALPPRGVPVEQVLGLAAGTSLPPDDETVRRWTEERRREKYS